MDPLAVHLAMERGRSSGCGRARARPSIEARGLPLLPPERPVPRQRLRLPHQGGGGRVARPRPARAGRGRDDRSSACIDEAGVASVREQAQAGDDGGRRPSSSRPTPTQARQAPHPARAVARPRLRRRRHPRRRSPNSPARAPSSRGTAPASSKRGQVHRRRRRGSWTAGWARTRASSCSARTCTGSTAAPTAPPRAWPKTYPGPRARHADQRERLRRARRRAGPRRPVPAGRRVHVPRLHVGRGRPGVQPDRQGAAHVRRRQPRAARAAHEGRDGLRLRLPAPDGPRGHLRHQPRLADRRPVDRRRLRRA